MSTIAADNRTIFTTQASPSCKLFPDSPHKCDAVDITRRLVSTISLLGCLFMIAVIWLFRKYTILPQRLILYLSISAFVDCIAYLVGGPYLTGPVCTFQAFLTSFADWANLIWVCVITFNLYMNAVHMKKTNQFEWAYHLVAWVLSLAISCLPFIGNVYGPSGAWCWIIDNWEWRFGIWYCPLYFIVGILIGVYTYIVVIVKRKVRTWEGLYDPDMERNKQMLKEEVKPLMWYPFVYLGLSLFPLINRIHNATHPYNPSFPLVLLMVIFSPMLGAANALVFGMDKETRSRLTPSQIRLAFQAHWYKDESMIQEYPTTDDTTDITSAEEQTAQADGTDQSVTRFEDHNSG